jgi:hypothetical protein
MLFVSVVKNTCMKTRGQPCLPERCRSYGKEYLIAYLARVLEYFKRARHAPAIVIYSGAFGQLLNVCRMCRCNGSAQSAV